MRSNTTMRHIRKVTEYAFRGVSNDVENMIVNTAVMERFIFYTLGAFDKRTCKAWIENMRRLGFIEVEEGGNILIHRVPSRQSKL